MLTDGEITDMEATINQIKKVSILPMSIIIVGVGTGTFEMMKELDDDEGKLFTRDCVQFVKFHDYFGKPHELAKDVLAEVPNQLLGFMKSKKILPKKRN